MEAEAGAVTHPSLAAFPGFFFLPTDEELIIDYLRSYVFGVPLPEGFVVPADVYSTEPWNLIGEGQDEGYFFARRVRSSAKAKRPCRTAGKGSWKGFKKDEEIKSTVDGRGMVTVATKHSLCFKSWEKKSKGWIMYEFVLRSPGNYEDVFQELVLCHIKKSHQEIAKAKRVDRKKSPAAGHDHIMLLAITAPGHGEAASSALVSEDASMAYASDDQLTLAASEYHASCQYQWIIEGCSDKESQQSTYASDDQLTVIPAASEYHASCQDHLTTAEFFNQELETYTSVHPTHTTEEEGQQLPETSSWAHALVISGYALQEDHSMIDEYFYDQNSLMENQQVVQQEVQLQVPAMSCIQHEQPLFDSSFSMEDDQLMSVDQGIPSTTISPASASASASRTRGANDDAVWSLPIDHEQQLMQLPSGSSADEVMTSWNDVTPWAQGFARLLGARPGPDDGGDPP